MEDYFELEHKKAIDFRRFRTTNHKLPIEQGRWDNIDRNNRICFLCNSDIGDEFHYILQCQHFKPSRQLLLSKYYNNHVSVLKFRNLMTSKNKTVLQINKDNRRGILRSSLKHTNHYLSDVLVIIVKTN